MKYLIKCKNSVYDRVTKTITHCGYERFKGEACEACEERKERMRMGKRYFPHKRNSNIILDITL